MKLTPIIKGLVVIFNLFGLFLCRLFFPVSVTVSQTAPSSTEINNSFLVQVAINKGDLNGVAKFAEQLPTGFNAVPIDVEGAKTSFDNNTIQFSWDSLPATGILNISFRVDVSSAATAQTDVLLGRFLYTLNNQKLEADCDPSNITITGGSTEQANNNISPQVTSSAQGSDSRQVDNVNVGSGGIFVMRQFPSSSIPPNTDAKITLTIHKANVTGFAKIEDSLPPGFTASGIDLAGASFTNVDNMAKFVWQNMPSDSVITISYRLSAGADVSGIHVVSGDFSYLYNGSPVTSSIGSTIFNTSVLAANQTPVDNSSANVTPPSSNNTANQTPVANNQAQADASVTPSIPTPVKGVNYRVQIMALHNPVSVSFFSSRKKIKGKVNTEMNEGFTKYTIGNYSDYKTVRDAREDVKNKGIDGPFVVSYNSGVRITVQEALMISHQQWYK